MSTLRSELFRILTPARPDRVWGALTATQRRLGYLYGMMVETAWQPGSPIVVDAGGEWRLTGEVLAADPPLRLSYSLGDTAETPSVYVTWEIVPTDSGTLLRLFVDDPDSVASDAEDLETVWTTVLSRLAHQLDCGAEGDASEVGGLR